MINNNKINNAFVQIIPEKIDITNYSNDKLRKILTIQNNCNIPLIFHLTPSDSSFILLTDNTVRISPKSKKKIAFIISDNLYKTFYKNKLFFKPKKLNIFIKNDLVEEKVEILLSYYCNKNYIKYPNNINNDNNFNFDDIDYEIIPENIKDINYNNINIFPQKNQKQNFYYKNNKLENFDDININNYYQEGKFYQNDYLTKIHYLNKMLAKSQRKIKKLQLEKNKKNFYGKLSKQKNASFLIRGKNKLKQNYLYQNEILKAKNNKLNNMVIYLQNKLTQYKLGLKTQKNDYNFNKNYIMNNYNSN